VNVVTIGVESTQHLTTTNTLTTFDINQ